MTSNEFELKVVIFREKETLKIGDKVNNGDGLMFATEDNEGRLAVAIIGLWPYLARHCIKKGIVDNLDYPTRSEIVRNCLRSGWSD